MELAGLKNVPSIEIGAISGACSKALNPHSFPWKSQIFADLSGVSKARFLKYLSELIPQLFGFPETFALLNARLSQKQEIAGLFVCAEQYKLIEDLVVAIGRYSDLDIFIIFIVTTQRKHLPKDRRIVINGTSIQESCNYWISTFCEVIDSAEGKLNKEDVQNSLIIRTSNSWTEELDPETLVFCGQGSNREVLECIAEAKRTSSVWAVVPDHDENGTLNKFRANLHNNFFTSDIAYALSSGVIAHRWDIQTSILPVTKLLTDSKGKL
eukprot:766334-Hanusia_phi.AAC.4